ncbi:hypothetical protein [Oceanobacillus luteolus]|uniref:Uncharacterized protein n=1 Tax=Oceanobacillus luteolus TaxID=1274358 RepID=A0ABW4HMX0_9BACI
MENSTKTNSLHYEETQITNDKISDNLDTIAFYLLEAIERKMEDKPEKKGA